MGTAYSCDMGIKKASICVNIPSHRAVPPRPVWLLTSSIGVRLGTGKPRPLVACALPGGTGDMKSGETKKVSRPECLAVPLEGWEQSH